MTGIADDTLRLAALQCLGEGSSELAREALECGVIEVEPNVLRWTGSLGPMTAHRVLLVLPPEVHARVDATPSAVDALTVAIASAISRAPCDTLAELKLESSDVSSTRMSAYRGRVWR